MEPVEQRSTLDDALAEYMIRTRMALPAQIQDARDSQAMAAEHGLRLPLGEALVRLGIITAQQRQSVESLLADEHSDLTQLGNYRLIKKLGAGMMGAVYLAEDTLAQRQVALKILAKKMSGSKQLIERFKREAQAAGRLNHLNIVTAFAVDSDKKKGIYFYVMEYCDGESLESILKREDYLLEPMALDLVAQVCRGLEHAHKHGIVHRDIKPGNIMLNSEGVAKILDMGLSKDVTDDDQSYKTQSGLAVGTPHYMSPEQIKSDGKLDGRADIYSLGATLYHLVTGKPPYAGATPNAVMSMHLSEQIPNPQDIRPELSDNIVMLIGRMLAKEPDDRYQNCKELLDDVTRVIDGKEPLNKPSDAFKSALAPRRPSHGTHTRIAPVRDKLSTSRTEKAITLPEPGRVKIRALPKRPVSYYVLLGIVTALSLWVLWLLFYSDQPILESQAPPANAAVMTERKEDVKAAPPKTPEVTAPAAPAVAPPPAQTQNTNPPPAAIQTTQLPPPAARAIDLMPLLDMKKHALSGSWNMKAREVSSAGQAAKLELPYEPGQEYDFKIVFTRVSGQGDVNMLLTSNGKQFMWMMGAYGGGVCGFEVINGQPAVGGRARVPGNYPIENNRKHTAIVKVRKDNVEAWLNDKLLVSMKLGYKSFSLNPVWKFRSENLLGLGTYNSAVIFHAIEVLPVTGAGSIR
ncbi:MAG TPA: serine/threonine-protein kinase [Planctomycetota bacterium]|nr:serine/threonine-protein kinase [Planctomycetota bacterium]